MSATGGIYERKVCACHRGIERHRLLSRLNLAQRGYDLLVASAGDRLTAAAQDFREAGVTVHEIQTDLATREGVEQLAEVLESIGSVEVACINAGVGIGGLFYETDEDAEINMIELNCVGTVQLAKHVVRKMKTSGGGRFSLRRPSPARWSRHEKLSTRQRRPSFYRLPTAFEQN